MPKQPKYFKLVKENLLKENQEPVDDTIIKEVIQSQVNAIEKAFKEGKEIRLDYIGRLLRITNSKKKNKAKINKFDKKNKIKKSKIITNDNTLTNLITNTDFNNLTKK